MALSGTTLSGMHSVGQGSCLCVLSCMRAMLRGMYRASQQVCTGPAGAMYAEKQRPPPTPPFEGLKLGRMLSHSEGVKVYQGRYRGSNVIVRVRPTLGTLVQVCCLLSGSAVASACAGRMHSPSMPCVCLRCAWTDPLT